MLASPRSAATCPSTPLHQRASRANGIAETPLSWRSSGQEGFPAAEEHDDYESRAVEMRGPRRDDRGTADDASRLRDLRCARLVGGRLRVDSEPHLVVRRPPAAEDALPFLAGGGVVRRRECAFSCFARLPCTAHESLEMRSLPPPGDVVLRYLRVRNARGLGAVIHE